MTSLPRWMSGTALLALAATVLLAVGSPAAASTATNVKSTVTITSGEGTLFTGKVTAGKQKCRAGRTVKLYREPGPSARAGDTLVGSAMTNANGAWSMAGAYEAGVYYAWLTALTVHVNGVPFRCGADWSIPTHY